MNDLIYFLFDGINLFNNNIYNMKSKTLFKNNNRKKKGKIRKNNEKVQSQKKVKHKNWWKKKITNRYFISFIAFKNSLCCLLRLGSKTKNGIDKLTKENQNEIAQQRQSTKSKTNQSLQII